MWFRQIMSGVFLTLASAIPVAAQPVVVIRDDPGGQIGPYVARFERIRYSGERVVIDGVCASACTLALGLVPPHQLFITRSARFRFHAAWEIDAYGYRRRSPAGTQVLWNIYPPPVRRLIRAHGGLTERTIEIPAGTMTRALYPY